jgi:hypothetical protein
MKMRKISKMLTVLTMTMFAFPAFAGAAPTIRAVPGSVIGGYEALAHFTVGEVFRSTRQDTTVLHDARWQFDGKYASAAYVDTAPSMTGMPRLAIGGYDTVAYFAVGKAVPGTLEYQTVWHDARWQFASKEDLDLFTADPKKYAAQYDGHCAMGVAFGHKATVDPEAFTIVDGKLYVNHTKYWTTVWRQNEAQNIIRADNNWPSVEKTPEPSK